jgi:ribosomal-protein-alanine N-acetyltransferase
MEQVRGLEVRIRWVIRRDMAEVLEIERSCFEHAWTEEDFLCCLRQRNCIGMVAEHNHEIVGFMIYELHKSKLWILNFAVIPSVQRQLVGTQMMQRLKDKLTQQKRKEIILEVYERNLPGQLFFKSQGFRAYRVIRGPYENSDEDAYSMRFRPAKQAAYSQVNRITGFEV